MPYWRLNMIPDNYDMYVAYEREQERIERLNRKLEIEEDKETDTEEC